MGIEVAPAGVDHSSCESYSLFDRRLAWGFLCEHGPSDGAACGRTCESPSQFDQETDPLGGFVNTEATMEQMGDIVSTKAIRSAGWFCEYRDYNGADG